ncbi:MAG: hypothetical protein RMJ82_00395 [Gemmatales bacterium]|nr:hypothetical protein [Gemmatales bacterium]
MREAFAPDTCLHVVNVQRMFKALDQRPKETVDSILSYAVDHIKDLAEALVFELIIPRYLAEYNGTFREQLVQHL